MGSCLGVHSNRRGLKCETSHFFNARLTPLWPWRALLALIRTAQPSSISELAGLTGRKQGNLSRTLKTMSRYGLVKMEKNERAMRPVA